MRSVLIVSILILVIAVFQNCSEVRLRPVEKVVTMASSNASFSATVCPVSEPLDVQSTKFVFVLDMSLSNIGGKAPVTGYFTGAMGSDVAGDRFEIVKNFMSTCAGGSANQYAIVAFSNGAGRIVNTSQGLNFQCDGQFSTPGQATADLNQLIALQEQDKAYWAEYDGKPYYGGYQGIMGNTSYSQALNCVRNIVVNDLAKGAANSAHNYEVIFLSDGQPKDASAGDIRFKSLYDVGCESKGYSPTDPRYEECYLQGIIEPVSYTMQAALGLNKGMRYHAIYYKSPANTSDSHQQVINKYMGQIARAGGTYEPTILGLLKDELGNGRNPLCAIAQTQSALEFRPEVLSLVNLTVKRVNGVLEPDSDMDGLSDREEEALGSNPVNPRSQVNGVLDGVCRRIGTFSECLTMRNTFTCSGTPNALGVSECDLKILRIDKLYPHLSPGVDTDKDGMPDIIEILRGTDPGLADMLADPDGDGRTNKQEILENTEVAKSDSLQFTQERPEYTVEYINRQQTNACSYGAWRLEATTLPGLDNQTVTAAQPVTLNHARGENVYLVFYRQNPLNSANEGVQFYGGLVHSRYNKIGDTIAVSLDRSVLWPIDFEKLGEVMP